MEAQNFASAPQAVGTRKKYRDPADDTLGKSNMMHDKRVVRGNTYASVIEPAKQPDAAEVQKQREAQRRRLMRANQTRKRPGTPEAVGGRKHMDIQTDSYLEELTERTVEFEAETQTDFLLDRPPSPLFMPAKIGVDIETQIEDGELFDFDVECEPVLEVLVGKTLEQGMTEVLEEEELESLRRHQEDFEKRRNAELLEVQRMEAAEKRRADEMERRMQQQAAQRDVDLAVMRKVVSRSIAQAHLSSLKDRALAHLLDAGVFAEATQVAVDSLFLPGLFQMVTEQMKGALGNQALVQDAMKSEMTAKMDTHQKKLDVEKKRLAVIDEAERKAREEKKVEKLRLAAEKQRLEEEQTKMLEWEATQPPPPEQKWATIVADSFAEGKVAVNLLDAAGEVEPRLDPEGEALTDPVFALVAEDKTEELTTLLATFAAIAPEEVEGKTVMCKVVLGDPYTAEQFQTGVPKLVVAPPAEAPADGDAAADADAPAADDA